MALPKPVNTTDFYLEAIIKLLKELDNNVLALAKEIATLNKVLQSQKPTVQLDAQKVATAIIAKLPKSK